MKVYANLYFDMTNTAETKQLNDPMDSGLFVGVIREDEDLVRRAVLHHSPRLKFIQTLEIEVPEFVQELIDRV